MNIEYKDYFDYCESVNWHFNKISIYCNRNNFLFEQVLKFAKEYAYKNNIYTEEELDRKIVHQLIYNDWLSKWINKSEKRMTFYNILGGGDIYEFKIKLLKECYCYCESVEHEITKVEEFSKMLDMKVSIIYEYVMEYYIYILGNSIDSWNKKYEQIKNMKNRKIDEQKIYRYISYSEESKQLYESLECTSYNDFIKKLPKFCYEFCESVEFDIDEVRKYAQLVNISYQRFRKYASDYANDKEFKLISNKESLTDNIKKMGLLKNWVSVSEKRKRCYEYLGKGNYDEFKSKLIEACYKYAEKVNFDKDKLKEFAKMIDIVYPTLLIYIKKYMKNNLEIENDDIKKMLNPTGSNVSDDIRVIKWIDNSKKREQLYFNLGSLPYEEFRIALFKMCYEYGISVNFEKEKVDLLAENIDISSQVLYTYMRKYAISVLRMDEKMWQRIRTRK